MENDVTLWKRSLFIYRHHIIDRRVLSDLLFVCTAAKMLAKSGVFLLAVVLVSVSARVVPYLPHPRRTPRPPRRSHFSITPKLTGNRLQVPKSTHIRLPDVC